MKITNILDYFSYLGGEEVFTFHDENGQPDISKAREFAEEMRKRFGALLHAYVKIEQRVNRVFITTRQDEPVLIGDRLSY